MMTDQSSGRTLTSLVGGLPLADLAAIVLAVWIYGSMSEGVGKDS